MILVQNNAKDLVFDGSFIREVGLVTSETYDNVLIRLALELFDPTLRSTECILRITTTKTITTVTRTAITNALHFTVPNVSYIRNNDNNNISSRLPFA